MTEDQVRLLEADVAEPIESMVARAELRAQQREQGWVEYTVAFEQDGREWIRFADERFVPDGGGLVNVRGYKVTPPARSAVYLVLREPVFNVVLVRTEIRLDFPLFPGVVVTVAPGAVRLGI